MKAVVAWARYRIGMALLSAALNLLPTFCEERVAVYRGLAEQRRYDRYWAYATLTGQPALPFHRWREQAGWIRLKFGGAR